MSQVGEAWYDFHGDMDPLKRDIAGAERGILDSGKRMGGGFASSFTGGLGAIGSGLMQVTKLAVAGGLAAGAGLAGIGVAAVRSASEMESLSAQWEVLLGSTGAAKDRMAELKEFAATTPFEIPQVVAASKTLQVFGGDLLATGDNLRLVGDVASGTGQPFEETAMWFGRLYDAMKNGQPFGEAAMRLQEMGALSGDGRRQLEELAGSVSSGAMTMDQAWGSSMDLFGQFGGMMDRQSQTMAGQWSNLMDNIGQSLAGIGEILMPVAKSLVEGFNAALPTIREVLINVFTQAQPILQAVGGIVTSVISGIASAFSSAGPSASGFGSIMGTLGSIVSSVFSAFMDALPTLQEIAVNAFTIIGNIVSTVGPVIASAIGWIAENVLPALAEAFAGISSWVVANWPVISSIIERAAGIIGSVIQALWPIIEGVARVVFPMLGAAMSAILPVVDAILGAIGGFIDFITGIVAPVIDGFATGWEAVWTGVGSFFSGLWNGILQTLGGIVGNIIGIIKNVVGVAAEIPGPWQEGARQQRDSLAEMEASVRAWGTETVNVTAATGTNSANAMSNAIRARAGDANHAGRVLGYSVHTGYLTNTSGAWSWGNNTANAVAQGLRSGLGVVRTASGEIAAAVRGQIGILSEPRDPSSPLRGVTRWGGNLVETVAGDMRRHLGSAQAAARLTAEALRPTLAAPGVPRLAVGSPAAAAGMGSMGGSLTNVGGVTIHIHNPRGTFSPEDITYISRQLEREVRLRF